MKGVVNFKVGPTDYQLEVEEKSEAETLHKMIIFGNPPHYCHECQNNQYFRLDSHKAGEYFYTEVVCTKCGAKSTLTGKKDGSYYWKKFEKWTPNNDSGDSQSKTPAASDDAGSDLPF